MINITSQRTVALVTVFALLFSLAPFNAVQFAQADVGQITLDNVNGDGTGPYTADGTWETINGQPCWNAGQGFRYFIEVFEDLDDGSDFDEGETVLQTIDPAPCNGDFEGDVSNADKADGGIWPATGQSADPESFNLEVGAHHICAVLYHVGQQGNDIVTTDCLDGDIVVPADGSISGNKDDGQEDSSGWVMFIDENDNGELDGEEVSTETDEDGNYSFEDLEDGEYIVCEVDVEGWTQVSPEGCHNVELTEEDNTSTGNDFVNEEDAPPAPQCSDGVDNADPEDELADENDPGCWTDPNDSETYDPEDNDETDPTDVCPDMGGIQTDPEDCPDQPQGSISGTKFDSQENRLADWIIYLLSTAGAVIDSAVTDENGNYFFNLLEDGDYVVCEEDKVGWGQTSPSDNYDCDQYDNGTNYAAEGYDVLLEGLENVVEGLNFVNDDLSEVCDDEMDNDEDGLVDENDPDCQNGGPTDEICDDGIDNDLDGFVDENDSDCDDGGGGDDTQCSDGVDNTDPEDELADELDPGCWEDPNDSETYNSEDNDETDPTDVCPQDEGIQTNENQCTEEEEEESSTGGGGGGGTVLVASCDAVPSSTTAGTLVTFTADVNAVADEPVSYGWAGAVNGSGQQISTTFFSPGTYVALVSALDAEGRNDTATCSVEVSGTAVPPFTGLPGGTGGTGGEGGAGGAGAGGGTGGGIAQLTDDEAGEGTGTSTAQVTDEEEVEDDGPGFLAGIIDFLNGGIVLWIIIILLILLVLWWLFGRRKDGDDKGQVNPR